MRQHLQGRRRKVTADEGYTLTEMLVVIGIIGLIAAVLTPGLVGQMSRARSKAAQLQLETLTTSIEMFRMDVGRYPTAQEGLTALVRQPDGLDSWTGPYVRDVKVLNDPWGRPTLYHVEPDGRRFSVESLGEDGRPGGKGADRDLRAPAAG